MRRCLPLAGLVGVAAALRLPGLGAQSFWHDEVFTVTLVDGGFGDLFDRLADTEGTPPLYYALLWPWERVFGDGEAALRSLSALFGIVLVPVAYAIGQQLSGRRAGLIAAALVAVNPYLIWYSQEARAYSLFALLAGASLLFFLRAFERRDGRSLWWWAALSALAIASHYYAGYLVAIEAVVLLATSPRRRDVVPPVGVVVITGALLAPLVLAQRSSGRTDWIDDTSLASRLVNAGKRFMTGPFGSPVDALAVVIAMVATAALVLLLKQAPPAERARALLALAVGLGAIAIPLVLALAGFDYFSDNYLIGSLVVLVCVVAAGLAAPPARWAAAMGVALCGALAAVAIVQQFDEELQREDWRQVARDLGAPHGGRVIVVDELGSKPLELYLGADTHPDGELAVHELVLGESVRGDGDRSPPPPQPPGFTLVEHREGPTFRYMVYRAPNGASVSPESVRRFALTDEPFVLQQAN
jgi:mannosyltransferase